MLGKASVLIMASLVFGVVQAGAAKSVTCKDGTTATAGRGACHGHGGVDKSVKTDTGQSTSSGTSASGTSGGTTVTCKDGTTSKGGRGACHGHGGVAKSTGGAPAAAAPAAAPAPAPVAQAGNAATGSAAHTGKGSKHANTDSSGALAKCRDGMYWHGTHHSGACSHHGGVDSWLDG